jgi:hypothetical protein
MSRVFVLILLSECVFSPGPVSGPKVQRGNNTGGARAGHYPGGGTSPGKTSEVTQPL